MTQQTKLRLLTLAGLAHRCSREEELYFQRQSYDSQYCFELFRRTIMHQNQRAWELVYTQYYPLVTGWIERHSAFADSGEEIQYFVNRAFEKMWGAMTPDKFNAFTNLPSLLRYLQMCVNSVIIDHTRRAEHPIVNFPDEVPATDSIHQDMVIENLALDNIYQQRILEALKARMRDEQEWRVASGTFILNLKPREICACFPEIFCDVSQVYRVKENVLARLRRDTEFLKLLDPDT